MSLKSRWNRPRPREQFSGSGRRSNRVSPGAPKARAARNELSCRDCDQELGMLSS